ncbi:MAG: hypothetical protein AAB433_02635 [Nitrospirota bacterium]|jgi:hypothetical protein
MTTPLPDARWLEIGQEHTHQIQSILNSFPFAVVHRKMTTIDWQWHHLHRVPTLDELRAHAQDLLLRVATAPHSDGTITCCIGGLRASRYDKNELDPDSVLVTKMTLDVLHEIDRVSIATDGSCAEGSSPNASIA